MVHICPECEGKCEINGCRNSGSGFGCMMTIGYYPKKCPTCYGLGVYVDENDAYEHQLDLIEEVNSFSNMEVRKI